MSFELVVYGRNSGEKEEEAKVSTTEQAERIPSFSLAPFQVRVRPLSDMEQSRIPGEQKVSVFGSGGEGSLATSGTPRKEVPIGFGHGGRGWNQIVSEYYKPSRRLSDV